MAYNKEALANLSAVETLTERIKTDYNGKLYKKSDKSSAVPTQISTDGWESDSTPDYPFYYDIPVEDVTDVDRAEVVLSIESIQDAINCKLCPTNETLDGKIRIRSKSAPLNTLNVVYWIDKGRG